MHKSSFQFTDPIQHDNLNIHFLLGPSTSPEYLTLAERCCLKIVEVLETGTVGRLTIQNHSPKRKRNHHNPGPPRKRWMNGGSLPPAM